MATKRPWSQRATGACFSGLRVRPKLRFVIVALGELPTLRIGKRDVPRSRGISTSEGVGLELLVVDLAGTADLGVTGDAGDT